MGTFTHMGKRDGVVMDGVTEYTEGYEVRLIHSPGAGRNRLAIEAMNEGGFNGVEIDLLQVLDWLKANRPELIQPTQQNASKELDEQALAIYQAYPLKKGRGAALRAIKSALKKIDFDALLAATKAFAASWVCQPKHEWKFIPHPGTWYNQERWLDEEADIQVGPADVSDEVASLF